MSKVKDLYIRKADGTLEKTKALEGLSAYDSAVIGGYAKTETEFYQELGDMATNEYVDDEINDVKFRLDTIDEEFDVLEETLISESAEYEQLTVSVVDGYINPNGTSASGYYHVSITVKNGEKYSFKTKNGSNIRTYVVKNESGTVTRVAGADTWGKTHNYDIELTINENENNGTLYVCSLENNIGVRKEKVVKSINTNSIKDNSIPMSKIDGITDMHFEKEMVVPNYNDVEFDIVSGSYMGANGTMQTLSSGNYAKISAKKGEKYRARCSHGTNLKAYVLVKGTTVLKYYPQTSVSTTEETNDIDIEEDCDLYINSYKQLEIVKSNSYKFKESEIYGKKIMFFGDSITEGIGSWASLNGVAKRYNMMLINAGVGGSTYTTTDSSTQFSSIYNRITQAPLDIIKDQDYIILEGGVNDSYQNKSLGTMSDLSDYTTDLEIGNFSGAFEMAIRYLVSNCITTKIGFILTHKIKDNVNLINYFNRAKEICNKYSIPYLDLYNECGLCGFIDSHRVYFKEDGCTHPTFDAYKIFINEKVNSWVSSL